MPTPIGLDRVELARRITRALIRGMVSEEVPWKGKPVDEVLNDVDAWFNAHEDALVESTVDLGFLYIDRLLGHDPDGSALQAALAQLTDDDLVAFQVARADNLAERAQHSREARAALIATLGDSIFAYALGLALRAALPTVPL